MRHNGLWVMYYYGYTSRRGARDLLAIGRDPFHFEKVTEPMIDRGAPGSIDETHANKPSVIWHDGALYHFYAAVAGQYPEEVSGVAVARSVPWWGGGRAGRVWWGGRRGVGGGGGGAEGR